MKPEKKKNLKKEEINQANSGKPRKPNKSGLIYQTRNQLNYRHGLN